VRTPRQELVGSAVKEQSAISNLPPHRNVVEILGIVGPAPIPDKIFQLCPSLMREASSPDDAVGIIMRYHPYDLDFLLARNRQSRELKSADLFGMCLDVVLALRHLQRYRVLHFDVKPNNFLVTADRTLVLADFGCAQQATSDGKCGSVGSGVGWAGWMWMG
jgi:serine/threonine protein kinase